MDSRVRVKTFLVGIIAFLVVLTAVAFSNLDLIKRKIGYTDKASAEETEKEAQAQSSDQMLIQETPFGTQIGNRLTAFISDPTFFDYEPSAAEALLSASGKPLLSLILTSIEKDLRIQVVDAVGTPVEGYSFFVTLLRDGVDEAAVQYKDLDKDGVLYIAGLSPGDYQASLSPMEEFEIPSEPTRIRVKARIEYTPIKDIALLIRSEDEIDAFQEDTEAKEIEESDKFPALDMEKFPGGRGIDVSKYQKEIDWKRVKKDGISFAIIRCGYRGSKTGCLVEDPYFESNLLGAKEAGIATGLYFFTQATSEVEAVEEASMVLALLGEEKLSYPIFIDTEGAGGNGRADGLDKLTRTLVCRAFCETIETAGHRAGIYASRNWWNNNLDADELEHFETWLAEYTDQPKYERYYKLWQYTSKGKVDGIKGNVDLDLALDW
ncbi:MAG: glycoside hydrolase family 25 protein [Lachnospiraceae bacterium]|nr:glycoside hydrolase family 25 protein [Lachnospiraceae bacterium]